MKKELRAEALKRRNEIPLTEREEKSRRITAHILQSEAYQNAKHIFTFVSMGSEVETRDILAQAWKDGKMVAVPKTEKGRVMYFLPIQSFADLKEGRFGVMEPLGKKEDAVVPEKNDLFLVPGALFDRKMNRIGYGGGYYDTYFEKYEGYEKIGLSFASQVQTAAIPTEKTDIPLDNIVTENGWMGGRKHE
ncbi:5-formyltetrahydrofolate cyclo-ligase [Anaerotignum sp.]